MAPSERDGSSRPTERDPLLCKKEALKASFARPPVQPLASHVRSPTDEEPTVIAEDKGSVLMIAFLLMLVFSLGNRIFAKLLTYPMYNYPLFVSILSTFIYVPVCFAYIVPTMMYTNNITQEQRDIPKYKFAVMGLYDSIAGIMSQFAVNYIPNPSTIVLVQQSAIPISMAISKYALNAKYTKAQYVGAGVVLSGIFVVLLPSFFSAPAEDVDVSTNPNASQSKEVLWLSLLILSCIPMCLSSVYKEQVLYIISTSTLHQNDVCYFHLFTIYTGAWRD